MRAAPELELVSAAVSRRLEVGGKPHVIERMKRTRELLLELLTHEPLDAVVTPKEVDQVHALLTMPPLVTRGMPSSPYDPW